MPEQKSLYYVTGLVAPKTPPPGGTPEPWPAETNVLGKRQPPVDAYERVSGTAVFPSDVVLPRMLYAAVLRCPHPNARVVSLDVSAAEELPGVHAVICSTDQDANPEWTLNDDVTRIFPEHCRYQGEPVAAVAAETPYQAADAVRAIQVEYDVLPFVVDENAALENGAAKVHDKGNTVKTGDYSRGDVDAAMATAPVVVENTFRSACELQTPMEPHGCVANWDRDYLTLWESTQGVYAVQQKVAKTLDMPLSKVRVIGHYMGGGFGSKLRTGRYSIIAALLAKRTGRPVKCFLTREETFITTGNRPPSTMTLKAAASRDGKLVALDFTAVGASGAYSAGGTSILDWLVRDNWLCPNVRTKTTDVYINAGPARPFRAPGHPECSWALEQTLDMLAHGLGMDPLEFRLKNIPDRSQARDLPYTSDGLRQCLERGAQEFGWTEARQRCEQFNAENQHKKRGVGLGGTVWFVGNTRPPSTVVVKLFADGSVNMNLGMSDIGTGTKSVMSFVLAEELGVRPESIQIENADTGTTQFTEPSGGSKTVPTEAPTVRVAALELKRTLLDWAAKDLDADAGDLTYQGGRIEGPDGASIALTDISTLKERSVAVGVGYCPDPPKGVTAHPFGAQFCEVEVDTLTGQVTLLRFLGANESGRVMHRLGFDNQIFGGIVMGVGHGTTEQRVLDRNTGKQCTMSWHDYKLPTALDVPRENLSVPVDVPDNRANNAGAKGVGEPTCIPTAAAIANAVFHATGVRVLETPITPMRLNRLLTEVQDVP